jgi:hypothetical protein
MSAPTSMGNAQEYSPNPYEPSYPGATAAQPQTGAPEQVGYPGAAAPSGYQPVGFVPPPVQEASNFATQAPGAGGQQQQYGLQESPDIHPQSTIDAASQGYQPPSYGYEPPKAASAPVVDESQETGGSSGYEPPSFQPYSYEPPSYQPDTDDNDEPKLKKKSFMDDDDDNIPALRQPQDKSKSEKDRENEEMFRKAAEEDGKLRAQPRPCRISRNAC